jgi:ribosome-binding protein aMBF1 (putative translation factor)
LDRNTVHGYVCFPVVFALNNKVEQVIKPLVAEEGILSARLKRLESNPRRAEALKKARAKLGKWIAEEYSSTKGLAALRLKAGLSQQALAALIGTKQSNISRWEKFPGDMQYSSIKNMANALGTSLESVIQVIDAANSLNSGELK